MTDSTHFVLWDNNFKWDEKLLVFSNISILVFVEHSVAKKEKKKEKKKHQFDICFYFLNNFSLNWIGFFVLI